MIRAAAARLATEVALPFVSAWSRREEDRIRATGRPLNDAELADARRVEVASPEEIRVLVVDEIPLPSIGLLNKLGAAFGFSPSGAVGMSLRYGIFLRQDAATHRLTLVHEFVHTAQYERLGGISAFMRQYLIECLRDGYVTSALEQEADRVSREVIGL